MDTKLKNNHKLGILFIILSIMLPAIVLTELYPAFRQSYESVEQEDPYLEYDFLEGMASGNYVLYLEEKERQSGKIVSPLEIFLPGIAQEESRYITRGAETVSDLEQVSEQSEPEPEMENQVAEELKQELYSRFARWTSQFEQVQGQLEYQMVQKGSAAPSFDLDLYQFAVAITYDELGKFSVQVLKANDADYIQNELSSILRNSLLDETLPFEYRYESNFRFQSPQNCTFYYLMTNQMMQNYVDSHHQNDAYYIFSDRLVYACLGFFCIVACIALLLPFVRSLQIGQEKLFRLPFEIAVCLIPVLFAGMVLMLEIAGNTMIGNVSQALVEMNFLWETACLLEYLLNIVGWSALFALAYWLVTCFRAVFTLGLMEYIRKRTLIYRIYALVKRMLFGTYKSLLQIDLTEKSNRIIAKVVIVNFIVLCAICSLWFFGIAVLLIYSVILFCVLKKYYHDLANNYQVLLAMTNQIASGNLDVDISENIGVFEPLKMELEKIQMGFKRAVKEEVKSQRMKTDLITNVSHDLKTPLTAIITYVNLLKEESTTEEQRKAYIDVLESKSMRLKVLIEDLFEISKATSQNVTLNLDEVDLVNLLKEVQVELSDKIEESLIEFRFDLPSEKVICRLDSQKTYRVFENLLINILKYAMPNTRAYVDIQSGEDEVIIHMKNVSANELDFNTNEITDRFVRGDRARNTDGSGLGLAIAKSFVELQDGVFYVESEADLFKVTIRWPKYKELKSHEDLPLQTL